MKTPLFAIECDPGKIIHVFTEQETHDFEQQWMNTFCKQKQGANTKAYKWHIFSSGKYPSISGHEAVEAYFQQEAPEYIVLSNDRALAIAMDMLPKRCDCSDYYVFPKNMAWTMAFTHEDGWLGPYFARHPHYESLNKQNIEHIRKNKEIEKARQRGWC